MANDASDCSNEARFPVIAKAELHRVVESKEATIIDVNSRESFEKAHVPGAIHFMTQEKELTSLLPAKKDALIVAYCGGVKCTAWKKAAEVACKAGYTNIKHFKEGIKGWVQKD